MNRWIIMGVRQLAKGTRAGTPGLTGLGAFMLGVGLIKRFSKPQKQLLYSKKLKPGKTIRIRMVGSDEELEISA